VVWAPTLSSRGRSKGDGVVLPVLMSVSLVEIVPAYGEVVHALVGMRLEE